MVGICIIPRKTKNGKTIVVWHGQYMTVSETNIAKEIMANQKKRFEFENTFGNRSRSPKRPKLEVIQRPSTSGSRNASFDNGDDNDDLWGDELENDVVQEVILLESQAFPQKPVSKTEPISKPTVGVFKPKTATAFPENVARAEKDLGFRDIFSDCGFGMKETKATERRIHNLQPSVTGVIKPLVVEKVKSHAVGKGCTRSNSMPTFGPPGSSSTISKPWSEIKDLSRNLIDKSMVKAPNLCDSSRAVDNSEEIKSLQKEIEKLRSEAFTKAGEAALLRQKIKDASLDLERERNYRATLLEKTSQKHQQEVLGLNRELEAAKTQLQFKELDVDKAVEKCKLLEAGNLKVRPMELKLHSTLRSTNPSDFPNRSTFENTPKKRAHSDHGSKCKRNTTKTPENPPNKVGNSEMGVQTEDKFIMMQKSRPELFSRVSEGEMLGQLIVPVWFEMDSGATEEQFENKWEGVSAITELLKMTTFQGEPLESLVEWCWKRMLAFLYTLRQRSEDDYKFHRIREESRRQYEEWCLDRRIPLPPQKQSVDEGLKEDWFCGFAEDSVKDELQCLLSFRPWCPKDLLPEIRRTLALITVLIRVSKNMASAFSSHNQKSEDGNNRCYVCDTVIKRKNLFVQTSAGVDGCSSVRNNQDSHDRVGESLHGSEEGSSTKEFEMDCMPTCPASKKICDSETETDIEGVPKEFLKFDFVHVVQQMCRVISGMRRISPMEGTLAGVLAFLSGLGEQLVLSTRSQLLVSAVVKDILFIRPHLRILPLLMKLLSATGEYPLILQKLCVNSAWNTAYRDKWKNIWMFSKGVCPLQVLITILGNVADERIPDGVNTEIWLKFRAKIALLFIQWLNAALTQPGHQVDWLCYVTNDEPGNSERKSDAGTLRKDSVGSVRKAMHSNKEALMPNRSKITLDESNPPTIGENSKEKSDNEQLKEKFGNDDIADEDVRDDLPYKSLSELSVSKLSSEESDNEKEELEEPSKKCCCRRWIINILVNILFAVLSDLQSVSNPADKLTVKEEGKELYYKASKTVISNKKLEHEHSLCLRLGLFVLRALLRREHPELNTPGGEGFLWNHYTVKGSVLINGQIVRKDYSHKNTHGGPIGGRYVLLLSKIEKQMKGRIMDFCPETEKALQELLEVEKSVRSPSEDGEEDEEESNIWVCMRNIGCNEDT